MFLHLDKNKYAIVELTFMFIGDVFNIFNKCGKKKFHTTFDANCCCRRFAREVEPHGIL